MDMKSQINNPPSFSVVVPVFNCSEYVGFCIDSILSQNYEKFDLILVDDGSNDGSYEICCRYSASDSRVRAIRKENGGPFSARLAAYPYITGDYVLHVDADDALAPKALSRLADIVSCYAVDIVFYEFSRDKDFRSVEHRFPFAESRSFDFESRAEYLNLAFSNSACLNTMWSKAVRADLLRDTSYPQNMSEMVSGEDHLQSLYILSKARSAYYYCEPLYYYRYNSTGITATFRYSDLRDHEILYEDFGELLGFYRTIPGFALTEADNDRHLILSCFHYLRSAAKDELAVFLRACNLVRGSSSLAKALGSRHANKGLRTDANLAIFLVRHNLDLLCHGLLTLEIKIRTLRCIRRRFFG